jgi:hypothetical protein
LLLKANKLVGLFLKVNFIWVQKCNMINYQDQTYNLVYCQ